MTVIVPRIAASATAATRWFRRPPVWLGRRFARGAGRLPATRRRRTAFDALAALQALVDPLTRGDPTSPLRWTCKSRAKLAAALTEQGWRVSSTTVGRLLHRLGYRLQSARKRQEGATHPDRNAQFEHINQTTDEHLAAGQPVVSVGAFPISRSRAHTHRRHGHPLQTVPSAGLIVEMATRKGTSVAT